jgi:hypothetical protein
MITVLGSCSSIGSLAISAMSVPASVASGSANIILLGIIALPLSQQLLFGTTSRRKLVYIVSIGGLSLTVCTFVPAVILSHTGSIARTSSSFDDSTRRVVVNIGIRISVAYYLVYFIIAVITALTMGYGSWKATSSILVHQKVFLASFIVE